jgi:hypothetical protein
MAPTRDRDRHGTPILISCSPSARRSHSSTRKRDITPLRGIAKLPPRPSRAPEQGTMIGHAKACDDNLKSGERPVSVSGSHGHGSNSVNINGQLLPPIHGLPYGLRSASEPQPIPNIVKIVPDEYGKYKSRECVSGLRMFLGTWYNSRSAKLSSRQATFSTSIPTSSIYR